jgi:hypothetical protein
MVWMDLNHTRWWAMPTVAWWDAVAMITIAIAIAIEIEIDIDPDSDSDLDFAHLTNKKCPNPSGGRCPPDRLNTNTSGDLESEARQ